MELDAVAPISQYNRIELSVGQMPAQAQTTVAASIPATSGRPNPEDQDRVIQERMDSFKQAVDKQLEVFDAVLAFRRDEDSGQMIAEIRDRNTGEVLREVPPEEMRRIAKSVREYLGLVVDVRN
jgi:flagellar protein FlaG